MAKDWWEDAPLAPQEPEEKKKEQAWWESAPLASAQKAPAKPEPTESGGFTGSFVESLKERFGTAAPTAKLFTGLGDRKQATEELLKAREESQNAYKQTEFSDIGDSFKQGNFGEALGKTVDKFKEVAGSSFGSMAPAAAAGYGAGMVGGPLVGMAAFGVVSLGSYIADNIGRQKEEQKKLGREDEDINRLTATTAAAGQTALDIGASTGGFTKWIIRYGTVATSTDTAPNRRPSPSTRNPRKNDSIATNCNTYSGHHTARSPHTPD